MMKQLLVALLVCLLTACASRTAEDAYKEGNYLESIELIAVYVEDKGAAKLNADDLERLSTIVSNVMAHYENQQLTATRTDYASRIESYESLLKMHNRLSNRFYSQQLSFFNHKYEVKQLRQLIAEEYYLYGNSINAIDADSYRLKANLYHNGLEQYQYKDIEKLYNQANTKYMQVAAKEYYERGRQLATGALYKDAAEQFAKAAEVYKPLGKYKDSEQQSVAYDKKYRSSEAQNFYQQAEEIKRTANTHFEFRQIATLYNDAYVIYGPYGDYKNSGKLANEYKQKGMLKIYSPPTRYSSQIEQKMKAEYIQFVSNPSLADIVIDITAYSRYKEFPEAIDRRGMSENILDKTVTINNADGTTETKDIYKTYYYTLQSSTLANIFELKTTIEVTGLYRYSDFDDIKESSSITKYIYSGDVPKERNNYNSGFYRFRHELEKNAQREQERYINGRLTNLAVIFSRL